MKIPRIIKTIATSIAITASIVYLSNQLEKKSIAEEELRRQSIDYTAMDASLTSAVCYDKYWLIDVDGNGSVDLITDDFKHDIFSNSTPEENLYRFARPRYLGDNKLDYMLVLMPSHRAIPDSLQSKLDAYHALGQELSKSLDAAVIATYK